MFAIIWESASPYFLLSVLVAIVCLLLTYFLKPTKISHLEIIEVPDEAPAVDGSKIKTLAQAKPLLLAKELENNLPEHVKVLEKRVESEQLEAIFRLMEKHSDHFGSTLSMEEMKDQLHLYGL